MSINIPGLQAARLEADFIQHDVHRAETRDAGLEQVGADEGGKPQPGDLGHVDRAGKMRQRKRQHDEGSSNDTDESFNGHVKTP